MRTALFPLAILIVTALIGCATAQEPIGRGQAARTEDTTATISSPSENANTPRIQIADKSEFVRELARLGVTTSIADRDLIKRLFEWTPDFKLYQHRLLASFPQQPESESNINLINIDYVEGTLDNESGVVHVFLHSNSYCVRLEDVKVALGEPQSFFKESANLWERFKKVTSVYGANYQTSKRVAYSFLFEYQECAQRIFVTKNFK